MSTKKLEDLSTAMKSLSMRRENLYRALIQGDVGSSQWATNRREIDSINDAMEDIEIERIDIVVQMIHDSEAA